MSLLRSSLLNMFVSNKHCLPFLRLCCQRRCITRLGGPELQSLPERNVAKDRPPLFLHPAAYKVKHQSMFAKFVSTSPREYHRSLRISKQVEYMSAPTDNLIGHSIAETWGPPLISTFLAAMYVIYYEWLCISF